MSSCQPSNEKYFSFAGRTDQKPVGPPESDNYSNYSRSVTMDRGVINGCIFSEAGWFKKPFKEQGLIIHDSDALLAFIGGDPKDPENLNAEIVLQIENDRLV